MFLERIKEAFDADPKPWRTCCWPRISTTAVRKAQTAWRNVVDDGRASWAFPRRPSAAALAYYDGYRSERLPANLLQAQRDYFGAHTYNRIDREGVFHSDWMRLRKATEYNHNRWDGSSRCRSAYEPLMHHGVACTRTHDPFQGVITMSSNYLEQLFGLDRPNGRRDRRGGRAGRGAVRGLGPGRGPA